MLSNGMREFLNQRVLSPEEEVQYFHLYREENDLLAKEILIRSQLVWLAKAVLKKYGRYPTDIQDELLQQGAVAITKLIEENFDITKGATFKTYASRTIMCKVLVAFLYIVWGPESENTLKEAYAVRKLYNRMTVDLGRSPSIEELHEKKPKISCRRIDALLRISERKNSLYYINSNGEETELEIVDDRFEKKQREREACDFLNQIIDSADLTENERNVLIMHVGLYGNENLTFQQIADMYGTSKTNISNIYARAIKKLKKAKDNLETNKSPDDPEFKEGANKKNKESIAKVVAYLKTLDDNSLKTLLEGRLTVKERDYIIRKYGLLGHPKQSVEEIANELGVSRPSVYQPINKGFEKLSDLVK